MKVQSKFSILAATLFLALTTSAVAGGGPCGGQGSHGDGCSVERTDTIVTYQRTLIRYEYRIDGELYSEYRDNQDRIARLTDKEFRKLGRAEKILARRDRVYTRLTNKAQKYKDQAADARKEKEALQKENAAIEISGTRTVTIETVTVGSLTHESTHANLGPDEYSASSCGYGYYGPFDGVCIRADKFTADGCDEKGTKDNGGQGTKDNGGQGTKDNGGQGTKDNGGQGTKTCVEPTPILNPKTNLCEARPVVIEKKKCVPTATQTVDPVTGECIDTPPPTKPIEKKKLVRTKDYCAKLGKVLNEDGTLCVTPKKTPAKKEEVVPAKKEEVVPAKEIPAVVEVKKDEPQHLIYIRKKTKEKHKLGQKVETLNGSSRSKDKVKETTVIEGLVSLEDYAKLMESTNPVISSIARKMLLEQTAAAAANGSTPAANTSTAK